MTGWTPVLEFVLQTPLAGRTTGTVNQGLILVDRYFELGLGASIRSMRARVTTSASMHGSIFSWVRFSRHLR